MNSEFKYSIFISHSTIDKPFVEKLKSYLEKKGVGVWLDNYEILTGQSIPERIVRGIWDCDFFGIVLSTKSENSKWVDYEIDLAIWRWINDFKKDRIFIIPIYIENCNPTKKICCIAYRDFRMQNLFEHNCEGLLTSILNPTSGEFLANQKSLELLTTNEASIKVNLLLKIKFIPSDYIARGVIQRTNENFEPLWVQRENADNLLKVTLRSRRVLLLADAGKGKSLELLRLVYELAQVNSIFVPVFASLNKYVDTSINEYLPQINGIPDEKLVIVLDAFDEIESKNKITAIKQIERFVELHPLARVLVSSRTNLFQPLEGFEQYHLMDLTGEDIEKFVLDKLGKRSKEFERHLIESNVSELVRNPFYLVALLKIFQSTGSLPSRKSEIFKIIIDARLKDDISKYKKTILDFDEKIKRIYTSLERIALTMEILSRNYLIQDEFVELIPDDVERDIIKHSGLLKKLETESTTWQFEHNNFQEFLAASVLSTYSIETIKQYTSFAPDYVKTKPTWLNTLAFLFSIAEDNPTLFESILDWIINIEIELVIKFERDKIKENKRAYIFKLIFDEHKQKRIWISYEKFNLRELARFGESKEIVEFLLYEGQAATHDVVLRNVLELFQVMDVPFEKKERLKNFLLDIALNEERPTPTRARALNTLTDLEMTSSEIVEVIIPILRTSEDTWIRYSMYRFLYYSSLLDEHVDVFLDGIKYLRFKNGQFGLGADDNNDSRLVDESIHLAKGLTFIRSPKALNNILIYITTNHRDLIDCHLTNDLPKIIEHIIEAYTQDPLLYNNVLKCYLVLVHEHYDKEAELVRLFFDSTNTREKVFIHIYSNNIREAEWFILISALANESTTEFIIDEYLAGSLTKAELNKIRHFIGWKNRNFYEYFSKRINERTNNEFLLPPQRDYEDERKNRFNQDIQLLFDREAFLQAILKIYETEGKQSFTKDELHKVQVDKFENPYFSDLAIRNLIEMTQVESQTFEQIQSRIDLSNWDYFCAWQLYQFMSNGRDVELNTEQRNKVISWCVLNVTNVDFKSSLKRTRDGGGTVNNLALLCWYFMRKFNFEYPNPTLLDMLLFDCVEGHQMVGIRYLEEKLNRNDIANRVLLNLNEGIEIDDILKNHLDYCKRHCIEAVVPFLINTIKEQNRDKSLREFAVDIALSFPGTIPLIESILVDITDDLRWYIVNALLPLQSVPNIQFLKDLIKNGNEQEQFKAAIHLMKQGDIDGLRYYIKWVKINNKSTIPNYDSESVINKFKKIETLPLLIELLGLTYEKGFQQDELHRLDSIILDTLHTIAIEEGYYEVVKISVEKFIEQNDDKYDQVHFLYSFLQRMERAYYVSQSEKYTLQEALTLAKVLV